MENENTKVAPDGTTEQEVAKEPPEKNTQDEKKYSDADVNAIIDKKFAKWQKDYESKVDEAKKLAEMNAQQKAEFERDKLQKQLDELTRKETLSEMTKTARSILKESGVTVDDDILGLLVTDNAEDTQKAVTTFSSMFKAAVDAEVNERLKSTTPKRGATGTTLTKEQINEIKDPVERRRLIDENSHLYIK